MTDYVEVDNGPARLVGSPRNAPATPSISPTTAA
jgi:hypothetical protein